VTTRSARNCAPPLLTGTAALFLDFDGTLVELAPRPDLVVVHHHLPALLNALCLQLRGAVAWMTGRALATVDGFVNPLRLPGAGLHGAELRISQEQSPELGPACASVLQLARQLDAQFVPDPRVVVENKLGAVALHFRQAPERMLECDTVMHALAADFIELEVIRGSMVVEARLRGADKGLALRRLLSSASFRGRYPVVIGDDRTDEDAFATVRDLHGYAVKVGSGPSLAEYRLPNVVSVHAWLSQSLLQLGAA